MQDTITSTIHIFTTTAVPVMQVLICPIPTTLIHPASAALQDPYRPAVEQHIAVIAITGIINLTPECLTAIVVQQDRMHRQLAPRIVSHAVRVLTNHTQHLVQGAILAQQELILPLEHRHASLVVQGHIHIMVVQALARHAVLVRINQTLVQVLVAIHALQELTRRQVLLHVRVVQLAIHQRMDRVIAI